MHSYWDDLFALRGFVDAAYLAGVLGHEEETTRLAALRDEFQHDLAASIGAAMAAHKIDYIPGCADLGDFDATSTTIALDPLQAGDVLPRPALERTFDRYWEFFTDRRDGRKPWEAFTPYEMRTIGALVELGRREDADSLLEFFLGYRRPAGWKQWAEVVWHDARAPHFIGDMPHTWVGSDFVRSVLDMLAYPREADDALVVGAGVPLSWLAPPGITVRDLATPYGDLGFTMRTLGDSVEVWVGELSRMPPGGVVVSVPSPGGLRQATVDGEPAVLSPKGEVVLRALPAAIRYGPAPRD
jgi:hypothetical protein